jgi:Uma2 family endonuclease
MTASIAKNRIDENLAGSVFYPSSDGEPIAETYAHLMAIFAILSVMKQYLAAESAQLNRSVDKPGTVLSDQFLYYAEGYPKLRVAPDVMIILNVAGGGRDNYKIWEEGEVPSVVFEVTSKGTQKEDQDFKQKLYERLGVQEYWQFDPKGEWIPTQLKGYQRHQGKYQLITTDRSPLLKLRLQVEGEFLAFYREDNGQKLLTADELMENNDQLMESNDQLMESNDQLTEAKLLAEAEADRLREKLRSLGINPDALDP